MKNYYTYLQELSNLNSNPILFNRICKIRTYSKNTNNFASLNNFTDNFDDFSNSNGVPSEGNFEDFSQWGDERE